MFVFELDKRITNKTKANADKIDHIGLSVMLRENFNILTFPTF